MLLYKNLNTTFFMNFAKLRENWILIWICENVYMKETKFTSCFNLIADLFHLWFTCWTANWSLFTLWSASGIISQSARGSSARVSACEINMNKIILSITESVVTLKASYSCTCTCFSKTQTAIYIIGLFRNEIYIFSLKWHK